MSHAHQKGDLIPAEELDAYGVITMALISFQSDTKLEEAPQSEPDPLFPEWVMSVNAKCTAHWRVAGRGVWETSPLPPRHSRNGALFGRTS